MGESAKNPLIFIISSFGSYEDNYQNSLNDWKEFSTLIEKLGGCTFITYLVSNRPSHPYILIGSDSFKTLDAIEYKSETPNIFVIIYIILGLNGHD
jgi:hypothetical protein